MADIRTAGSGTIHDIGYQRYRGVRLGRGYARTSLFTHGVRTAFGFGRSGKAKIFPWFSGGVLLLIAVVLVAIRAQTGQLAMSYIVLPSNASLLVLLFLATAAPELVSRDLRGKVLPLYFSRPMHRSDYAFAKLGAMIVSLWLIIAVPQTVMFAGSAFTLHGAGKIASEFLDYGQGVLAGGITAITYGVVGLLVASLLGRRMLAAAVIVGVFLVMNTVGFAIIGLLGGTHHAGRIGAMFSPQFLIDSLNGWLFDPRAVPDVIGHLGTFGWVYAAEVVALVAVATLALLARYRKVAA